MEKQAKEEKWVRLARRLVNPEQARILIEPYGQGKGYWFGGGNLVKGPESDIYLAGRYRNPGDSTTGLAKGERGLELAIFRSSDGGRTFEKIISFSKKDLSFDDYDVLSIEGSALNLLEDGAELFVSSEKGNLFYPDPFENFQKPGTGVWTIDRIAAPGIAGLKGPKPQPLFSGKDPQHLHVKDPVVYRPSSGATILFFCTHPFSWSSSNSAYALRPRGSARFSDPVFGFFPRGTAWDVAVTRISDVLPLPEWKEAGGEEEISLVFYDGAECLREHEQSTWGIDRPRGYSCEELGGLAVLHSGDPARMERVSKYLPLFVSPWGTGCCRYVHTLRTQEGILATWQQSQKDASQPLVMNFLTWQEVYETLEKKG
jgi:hypothetical protein